MSYWKYSPNDPNSKVLNAVTTGTSRAISVKDYEKAQWLIEGSAGVTAGAVVIESAHDPNYAGTWNQLAAPVTVVASAILGGFADFPPGGYVRARVTTNIANGTVSVYLNALHGE
jgi:hypothetical protein